LVPGNPQKSGHSGVRTAHPWISPFKTVVNRKKCPRSLFSPLTLVTASAPPAIEFFDSLHRQPIIMPSSSSRVSAMLPVPRTFGLLFSFSVAHFLFPPVQIGQGFT
jgi:hypothetical protein